MAQMVVSLIRNNGYNACFLHGALLEFETLMRGGAAW